MSIILLSPGVVHAQWSWAGAAGASSDQRGYAVASDNAGNTYVTGYIKNSGNQFGSNSVSAIGGDDIFIAKYDAAGNNLWVKRAGGSDDDHGRGIDVDSAGNIYITGNIKGTATFFGSPNIVLSTPNNSDMFVAKYDPSGNVLWARIAISGQSSQGNAVTVNNNVVFVTGSFGNTLSAGALPLMSSSGGEDVFVVAYTSATGTESWMVRGGGSGNDAGLGIASDNSGAYVTGTYNNVVSFQNQVGTLPNTGSRDIFIAKYSNSGSGIWLRHAGSGGSDEGTSICCNASGVYVGGYHTGTISFYNSGPAVANIPQTNGEDGLLFKLNSASGNFVWGRSESGSGTDQIIGVSITPNSTIYTCGYFDGTLPFGSGPSVTASDHDAFITKYDSAGVFIAGAREAGNDDDHATAIATIGNGGAVITGYFKSNPASFGSININANSEDIFVAMHGCYVTQAVAGSDQVLCAEPAFLTGNTPLYGTGLWSFVSGGGIILTPSLPSTTILNLDTGMNYIQWTISSGACSSSDTIGVILDANPTPASAGTDQQICSPTAVLGANVPLMGSGLWIPITGIGTIVNPLLPNTTVTGLTPGTHQFAWTIANLSCPLSIDTVTILIDSNPTVAAASSDQTICSDSSVVTGNVPLVGSGTWSLISGSAMIADSASASTDVLSLGTGVNVLQWTISNGTCPSSSDQVVITVDALPDIASAGGDQLTCSSSSSLNANVPATGNGVWSVVSGNGVISNTTSPTSAVTGMTSPVNIFEWKISNGVCPSSFDTVLIQVDSMPTVAVAGNDNTLCANSDSLSANIPMTGNGQWSVISGSGSFSNMNSPVCSVSNLSVGQNIFQWTISSGVCPPSTDQVIINVDDLPTPALVSGDAQTCSANDTITGNTPLTGTGNWQVITGSATLGSPNSPVTQVNNMSVGFNEFVWTITNGTCPSSADTLRVEYNEMPSAPVAGPDIFICGHSAVLQAQMPLTGTGTWTGINGGPPISDSANPAAQTPYLTDGVWIYTWTTQNGFCVSPPDSVSVHTYSPPTIAVAGTDRIIHVHEVYLNAMATDTGIGTWTFVQGSGIIENPNDPNTRVYDLALGLNILRWTTSNGVCASSEDDVSIDVHALIVPNGYSPNGDGVNDNFEIVGINEYPDAALKVFNRWGNPVYSSPHYRNDWNGTSDSGSQLPDDTYYYVLEVTAEDVLTGFVTIKRSAL